MSSIFRALNIPRGLIFHHGVQDNDEFSHTRSDRDFMGFAGLNGMLRRTLYMGDPTYLQEMYFAAFFGTILAIGYLVMMYNLISTIGIPSLISLFIRLPWSKTQSNIAS